MNQLVNLPDTVSAGSPVVISGLPSKTLYERRLDALYATMEMQDYRAHMRARQIAMGLKYDNNITQAKIAERVGWTQGNLALYLNGHKSIGRNVLPLMCVALECEPHDIRTELKNPRDDQVRESTRQTLKRQILAMDRWLNDTGLPEGMRQDMESQKERLQAQYADLSPKGREAAH